MDLIYEQLELFDELLKGFKPFANVEENEDVSDNFEVADLAELNRAKGMPKR